MLEKGIYTEGKWYQSGPDRFSIKR